MLLSKSIGVSYGAEEDGDRAMVSRRSDLRFVGVSCNWVHRPGCSLGGLASAVDDGAKYGTRETGLCSHGGTVGCDV